MMRSEQEMLALIVKTAEHDERIRAVYMCGSRTNPNAPRDIFQDYDITEYGYLWWLKAFQSGNNSYRAYFMTGTGGNKVVVLPELDMVVVTSTNYALRNAHQLTDQLFTEHILAAVEL